VEGIWPTQKFWRVAPVTLPNISVSPQFFCTVILTELSMFCVRLSHFIIKFDLIDLVLHPANKTTT